MTTSRGSVAELYSSIYDKFMLSSFDVFDGGAMQGFEEITTKQKNYIVDDLSGLGMWQSNTELNAGNFEDPVLGYAKTYTIGDFDQGFQVSFQAQDDDEYALIKRIPTAQTMGKGAGHRKRYDCAQHLYLGFSVASPDGEYLFDNDHPQSREITSTTYDNLLSGASSHDNLEAAETQISANMFDMKGLPIPITQDPILLFPPALRGSVQRVLNERATERPGTANRDINQFTARKGIFQYRPIEDVYLGAAMGGSDTAWYILFPWLGYFKFVWRQKPTYASWVDYNIKAYNFLGYMRYIVGSDNWRGGFASTGA